jgi:DNA-binding transcriptional LysR family regulator
MRSHRPGRQPLVYVGTEIARWDSSPFFVGGSFEQGTKGICYLGWGSPCTTSQADRGGGGASCRVFMTNPATANIPTELLRTLIAVVDLCSFTKAAQTLGITQPAVSAQIKRLQYLLGVDVFDKSAPGVRLTAKGELVVNYARRMLAINDQIVQLTLPRAANPPLRIGIPGLYAGSRLPKALAAFRAQAPDLRFRVRGDASDNLLRDLRQGQLDLALALTKSAPAADACHQWTEDLVWVRGAQTPLETGRPVSLITIHEGGLLYGLAISTLRQASRDFDLIFTASGTVALFAAVSAGLGITLLPRCEVPHELEAWDDAPLPKPSDIYCGIYLREGVDCELLAELADAIADTLRPRSGVIAEPRQAAGAA